MASTINASNGATSGLIQTGDASGVLALQTNNGTTAVTIDTSQNVGIGTASPSTSLTVSGANIAARGQVSVIGASSADPRITLYRGSTLSGAISCTSSQMYLLAAEAVPLAFYTSDTERARIDSSGNFGIGTTSPANPTGGKGFEISNSSGASVRITNATTFLDLQSGSAANYILSNGAFPMVLYTNSAERVRIDSSGNVGVGTSDPSSYAKFAVFGAPSVTTYGNVSAIFSDGATGSARFSHASGSVRLSSDTGLAFGAGSAGAERARITTSGEFIMGGTSVAPSGSRLSIVGSTTWGVGPSPAGSTFYIYNSSNVGVYLTDGANTWASSSDERKKDIIEPITDASNKVNQLRAVIGKYKTDAEGTRRSFLIAQDLQTVLPESVDSSEEDNLGVRYTDVIPLLVAAIKEQQTVITSLKARLDAANL